MRDTKQIIVTFRLTKEERKLLKELCRKYRLHTSQFLREAIRNMR